jgi:hypothetical protein
VRRLRAKLGTEHEQMIGTVRNVGYKVVRPTRAGLAVPVGALPNDTKKPDDQHLPNATDDRYTPDRPDSRPGIRTGRHIGGGTPRRGSVAAVRALGRPDSARRTPGERALLVSSAGRRGPAPVVDRDRRSIAVDRDAIRGAVRRTDKRRQCGLSRSGCAAHGPAQRGGPGRPRRVADRRAPPRAAPATGPVCP